MHVRLEINDFIIYISMRIIFNKKIYMYVY